MRVCYILNQFPELSQTFVLRQVLDLLERGHSVDVIAARPGDDSRQHAALEQHTARFGLQTSYTGMQANLLRRALQGALLAVPALLRHRAAAGTALDLRRFGWFAATGSLLTMGMPLAGQKRRYDALIAHFGPQGVIAQGLREMNILDGPLVTFFHAYDLTSAPRLAGRNMYHRLFERGDLQLAISERGARQLRELGAPPEYVRVHHMGVNVEQFRSPTLPRQRRADESLHVISIGRLVPKKGFDRGLRAVAKARERGARIHYSIFGAGPLATSLERSIDALGLRGTAKLCGPANQDHLAAMLMSADAYLMPSTTPRNGDEEGIPMVLMEALATELPVVASACGGTAELIEHDVCGLLVGEGDCDGMAAALSRLCTSPELRARLGAAGRARVLADFNERTQGHRLVELLAQLGAARTASSASDDAHVPAAEHAP